MHIVPWKLTSCNSYRVNYDKILQQSCRLEYDKYKCDHSVGDITYTSVLYVVKTNTRKLVYPNARLSIFQLNWKMWLAKQFHTSIFFWLAHNFFLSAVDTCLNSTVTTTAATVCIGVFNLLKSLAIAWRRKGQYFPDAPFQPSGHSKLIDPNVFSDKTAVLQCSCRHVNDFTNTLTCRIYLMHK